jgi:hypothetical protein
VTNRAHGGGIVPKQKSKTATAAAYKIGQKVRVRHGVKDYDYPDMPLGGWAGTIAKVHDDGMCTIRWSKKTLASIHSVFKKRCEKDGLEFDQYFIGADDLEPDPGGPLEIEQPQKISTKPLSLKNQDDRLRFIFALTSNDPLPDVNDKTLAAYHAHLTKKLVFPFTAEHGAEYGHPERVQVIGLGEPLEPMIDETYGILCDARLEGQVLALPLGELDGVKSKPNRQLIEDYCCWFWNWR